MAQFICKKVHSNVISDVKEFEPWELNFEIAEDDLSGSFKAFTSWFVSSSVSNKEGYQQYIQSLASFVEQCFAIWANVIEFEEGRAVNSLYSQQRVLLYILEYYGQIEQSGLQEWELELH